MKMGLGAALAAVLFVAGCAAPQPDSKQVAAAGTDQSQPAPKKKCSASTGSRLGSCDGSTPDVQGEGGDAYRNDLTRMGSYTANPH